MDEAHNLRDIAEGEDALVDVGGKAEKGDAAGGKLLTPFLRDVLMYSESMKFCALTATPMYNSYREIVFMLNLLLMNDKKATLTEADLFDREGRLLEKGSERLSLIAHRYVSFMREKTPCPFLFVSFLNRSHSFPSIPFLIHDELPFWKRIVTIIGVSHCFLCPFKGTHFRPLVCS